MEDDAIEHQLLQDSISECMNHCDIDALCDYHRGFSDGMQKMSSVHELITPTLIKVGNVIESEVYWLVDGVHRAERKAIFIVE